MKALGIGSLIVGLGGLALYAESAYTAANLLLYAGAALPTFVLAQSALTLLTVLLFGLLAVGGISMLAGKRWGANLARKLAMGLVLICGLIAIGLYLEAVGPAPANGASIVWLLFAAHLMVLLVGLVWPIVLVAVLSRPPTTAA